MQRTWPYDDDRRTESEETETSQERVIEESRDSTPLVVERIESEIRAKQSNDEKDFWSEDKPTQQDPPQIVNPDPIDPPTVSSFVSPPEPERPIQETQGYKSPPLIQPPPQTTRRAVVPRPINQRVKVTIRHFDPWSVLKFSVVFYFSVMLVFVFAIMLLFFVADAAEIVSNTEKFIGETGWPEFQLRAATVFRVVFLIGFINVIFWSAVNLLLTFLYNLVSDVIGGIQATTIQREQ